MEIPDELVQLKASVEFGLLSLPGVIGVGLGFREENEEFFEELAVRVLVEDANQVPDGLPEDIGGVALNIVERRYDPISFPDLDSYPQLRGGIKIEKPTRGTGTMGALVEDTTTGDILGLSCFHVVGGPGDAFPDQIWQPKTPPLIAGGSPPSKDDFVGEVLRADFPDTAPLPFSPIRVSMTDAAVFTTTGAAAQGRTVSSAIASEGVGQPDLIPAVTSTAAVTLEFDQFVRKRGFQTGVTGGIVRAFPVTKFTTVNWSVDGPNTFLVDQVEIFGGGPVFAEAGDSGSLILDRDEPTALGLLWGATSTGRFGMMSLIANVESKLGVSVVWA
jgi:hypothetical protein